MEFKEAIFKLIGGKKIRRMNWEEGHYWIFNEEHLVDSNGNNIKDWEEYNPTPTEEKIEDVKKAISVLNKKIILLEIIRRKENG